MNLTVTYRDLLAPGIDRVRAYLRKRGWVPGEAALSGGCWYSPSPVRVPDDGEGPGYDASIARIIRALAVIEGRSQMEVLLDIRRADGTDAESD